MTRLQRLAQLPWSDRRRVVRALWLLTRARLALWMLPFRAARRWADRVGRPVGTCEASSDAALAARVAWAVNAGSRFVPGATCLVRAWAARALLASEGVASTLRFGVGRGAGNTFRAHAWLECGGRVVVGGEEDLSRFAPLPQFG